MIRNIVSKFAQSNILQSSLEHQARKINYASLCIINGWHHTLPSHSFLEGSPNVVTSSQSVVGIVPTHCYPKTSDGSAVHFGLTPTSTSSYTVRGKLDSHCCIATRAKPIGRTVSDCPNETHVRQMVRPSILDSHRNPSPRIHSLFVR